MAFHFSSFCMTTESHFAKLHLSKKASKAFICTIISIFYFGLVSFIVKKIKSFAQLKSFDFECLFK